MPNYIPPAPKSQGQTLDALLDWNPAWAGLASYLNNGGIGNNQISSYPAEKIVESKLALTAATGAHKARHEPGGADEINDIDIGNTGTLLSAHAARHASGGADPIPTGGISSSMLAAGSVADDKIAGRKPTLAFLSRQFGITYAQRGRESFAHPNVNATPMGRGVVRSGLVYFACRGIDAVSSLNPATGTFVTIPLVSGDKPQDLCLIGTDIFVLTAGDGISVKPKLKKIDIANVLTTIADFTADGAAKVTTLDRASFMEPHPDGTVVYVVAKETGIVDDHYVLRVSTTPGTGVTHNHNTANAGDHVQGIFFHRSGSTEWVSFFGRMGSSANTKLRRVATADLTGATTFDTGNAYNIGTNGVYDGCFLLLHDVGAVSNDVRIIEPASQFEVAQFAPPTPGVLARSRDAVPFCDGKALYIPFSNAIAQVGVFALPHVGAALNMLLNGGAARMASGFATDGQVVWVAVQGGASNASYDKLFVA